MTTKEAALAALRQWAADRRDLAARRNPTILAAIAAGATDTEIHEASGISRTTIGQIRDPEGPLALREAARRALANRGVEVPDICTTKQGRVLLSLPYDPPELPTPGPDDDPAWFEAEVVRPAEVARRRSAWITRMNWAGEVIDVLRAAGISVGAPDALRGETVREHLAHEEEPYVVLNFGEGS